VYVDEIEVLKQKQVDCAYQFIKTIHENPENCEDCRKPQWYNHCHSDPVSITMDITSQPPFLTSGTFHLV